MEILNEKFYISVSHSRVIRSPVFAISQGEMDKISSTFKSLDNDRDGFISKEEADDDDIWEHFAKIDGDKDNEISRLEFDTYMGMYVGEVAEDRVVAESTKSATMKKTPPFTSSFSELDEDENGFISIDEADGDKIDKHFGYIDSDKDSRISESEFRKLSKQFSRRHGWKKREVICRNLLFFSQPRAIVARLFY
ncbi:EF-hand domain-containing protein [Paraglaciecola polaris]|uniref:EF-hand domain-containing protein n=1 Tax=Paraglaciecola polaris LMG 21857 TaxID=1129793 RepID=K6ZZB2_9ALTE|nr:hypothetical protein [Paraglaciecola polaris]GAC35542.1 hypothetical protein GPLA_4668 [Paraglaciecola polaris LMG 21857]